MSKSADLKTDNLKRLAARLPSLHRRLVDYTPLSSTIEEDGEVVDLEFQGQRLYAMDGREYAERQLAQFRKNAPRMEMRLDATSFDHLGGPFFERVSRAATEGGLEFSNHYRSDESFFLIIFGLGLGHHVIDLLEQTKCLAVILVEPSLEFIHHSLSTLDWSALLEIIDERKISFDVVIESSPDTLAKRLRDTMRGINVMGTDGLRYFVHYDNAAFQHAVKNLRVSTIHATTGLGFVLDECLMVRNAHHNLFGGKSLVYQRPATDRIQPAPAFVIGSGPSLDNCLDDIRRNAHRAVIISCGSALRPLMRAGITPDFHVEIENIEVTPLLKSVADDYDLSDVTLVTAVTIEPASLDFFKNIVFNFRASLSPWPLFGNSREELCLRFPNPTVTNAGLSLAADAGFREIYLFGVDMGQRRGSNRHHSKDSYHYTKGAVFKEQMFNIPVPGNLGGTALTSEGLLWARDSLGDATRYYSAGRRIFNCGDGATIFATTPRLARTVDLPPLAPEKRAEIVATAVDTRVYTQEEFERCWNDDAMEKRIEDFVQSLKKRLAEADFRNKQYMRELYLYLVAASDHMDMSMLFRGTVFQMVMAIEFFFRRLEDENGLKEFEEIARRELEIALDAMRDYTLGELAGLSAKEVQRRAAEA